MVWRPGTIQISCMREGARPRRQDDKCSRESGMRFRRSINELLRRYGLQKGRERKSRKDELFENSAGRCVLKWQWHKTAIAAFSSLDVDDIRYDSDPPVRLTEVDPEYTTQNWRTVVIEKLNPLSRAIGTTSGDAEATENTERTVDLGDHSAE